MGIRTAAAVTVVLLVLGGVCAPDARSATAPDVCSGLDSGKVETTGDPHSIDVTAPEGYRITRYCVKAGAAASGGGPVYVTVDPPQRAVTITHPTGKAVSHWSAAYIPCDAPAPPPETEDTEPPEETGGPDETEPPEETESPEETGTPGEPPATPTGTAARPTSTPTGATTSAGTTAPEGQEPEAAEASTTAPAPTDASSTSTGRVCRVDAGITDRTAADDAAASTAGGDSTSDDGSAGWIEVGAALLLAAAVLCLGLAVAVWRRRGADGG